VNLLGFQTTTSMDTVKAPGPNSVDRPPMTL